MPRIGNKIRSEKNIFTVFYRNPENKASSPEFQNFKSNFENLYQKIKQENSYVNFFTGDINAHSQAWFSEGDSNAEGVDLNIFFSDLNLQQLIEEPTHFFNSASKAVV